MLEETNLMLFLAASLVVIVAPGPDNILVLTRGITLGRGAGWSRRRVRVSGSLSTPSSRR